MNREQRQAVIDEYMAETGEPRVIPARFIEWLRPQHNHIAHRHFFAKSEEDAAQEYRVALFRQFASGLRISVKVEVTDPVTSNVSVIVRQFPAMISPVVNRRAGGGYVAFDHSDPAAFAELRRQGARAMQSWLQRYRDAFEGIDLGAIEEIAASQDASVALSA